MFSCLWSAASITLICSKSILRSSKDLLRGACPCHHTWQTPKLLWVYVGSCWLQVGSSWLLLGSCCLVLASCWLHVGHMWGRVVPKRLSSVSKLVEVGIQTPKMGLKSLQMLPNEPRWPQDGSKINTFEVQFSNFIPCS